MTLSTKWTVASSCSNLPDIVTVKFVEWQFKCKPASLLLTGSRMEQPEAKSAKRKYLLEVCTKPWERPLSQTCQTLCESTRSLAGWFSGSESHTVHISQDPKAIQSCWKLQCSRNGVPSLPKKKKKSAKRWDGFQSPCYSQLHGISGPGKNLTHS